MSLLLSPEAPPRRVPWGALASAFVHLALGALLLALTTIKPLDQPVEEPESIAVELVNPIPVPVPAPLVTSSPAPVDEVAAPDANVPAPSPSASTPSAGATGGLTKATKLFAAGILKEPASRKLAKTLSTFADTEKIVQLCNIEGLEQIRRAQPKFNPDVMVSYAMADTSLDGLTLSAEGGAFHSGRGWYAIRFRCTAAADYGGVTDFEFSIGKPIPRSEWDSHNLPAQYEDSE